MNHDPVKQAWQASVEIARTPPLDEVRKGADKLYRRVRRRNSIEYAACAIVIVLAGPMMLKGPHILHKIGAAMLVVAVLYVAWQLHRRASAVPPDAAGTMPIYEFLRGQLARQRDALRGVLWWYLLPLVPGMVLIFAGNGLDPVIEAAYNEWFTTEILPTL